MSLKTWNAGDQVLASDLNANFAALQLIAPSFTAAANITAGQGLGVYQGSVVNGTKSFFTAAAQFDASAINQEATCVMDTQHFIVVYQETSGAAVKVRAASIIGGVISYGTAVTLSSTITGNVNIVSLDATHFVINYGNTSGGAIRFVAGTLSGTAITMGSDTTVTAAGNNNTQFALIAISSTTFVCAFNSGAQQGAVAGTVSGTTITLGSVTSMGTSGRSGTWVQGLNLQDSAHFFVAYQGGTQEVWGIVGNVSGTTLSFGSETGICGASTGVAVTLVPPVFMDSSHIALGYSSGGTSPTCQCLSWSGTSITAAGTPVSGLMGNSGQVTACVQVDSTHVLMIGQSGAYVSYLTLSGTTWTITTQNTNGLTPYYAGTLGTYPYVTPLIKNSATSFVAISSQGGANLYYQNITLSGSTITLGTAVFISITSSANFGILAMGDGATCIAGCITGATYYGLCTPTSYVGIATTSVSSGAQVGAQAEGLCAVFSGLTAGNLYYLQNDGTVSTVVSAWRLGYAINTTTILMTTTW